jgi:hypothetical protein
MEPIYVFLIRNDVWIYILCGLGLFWYGNEFLRSRRLLRQAIFGLERERGLRIRNSALSFILLLAAVIGAVYYVNVQVAPGLPPELFRLATPTPDIFSTPLSSPTPLGTAEISPPTPTVPLVPTITLAGQPGEEAATLAGTSSPGEGARPGADETPGTSTPSGPTVTPFVACTVDLNISQPRDGAFVSGSIIFNGTADFPDFKAFRLEANGPETSGQWASLLGRSIEQPARDSFLGNVNLSQWQPGPYLIRLTGVNTAGSDAGYCVIQITLGG